MKNLQSGIIQKSFVAEIISGNNNYVKFPCRFNVEMGEVALDGSLTWVSGHILDQDGKLIGGKIRIKLPKTKEV